MLVLEAPEDPAYPPPNAQLLAAAIPGARLHVIPGMGHSIPTAVQPALAEAILHHVVAAAR